MLWYNMVINAFHKCGHNWPDPLTSWSKLRFFPNIRKKTWRCHKQLDGVCQRFCQWQVWIQNFWSDWTDCCLTPRTFGFQVSHTNQNGPFCADAEKYFFQQLWKADWVGGKTLNIYRYATPLHAWATEALLCRAILSANQQKVNQCGNPWILFPVPSSKCKNTT